MTWISYDEMTPDQQLAYRRGQDDLMGTGVTIDMCKAHFHRGDLLDEDDYPLISYCPSEEFRGSCHIVDALVVMKEKI